MFAHETHLRLGVPDALVAVLSVGCTPGLEGGVDVLLGDVHEFADVPVDVVVDGLEAVLTVDDVVWGRGWWSNLGGSDIVVVEFFSNPLGGCSDDLACVEVETVTPGVGEGLLAWGSVEVEALREENPLREALGEFAIAGVRDVLVEEYAKDGFEVEAVARDCSILVVEVRDREIEMFDNA